MTRAPSNTKVTTISRSLGQVARVTPWRAGFGQLRGCKADRWDTQVWTPGCPGSDPCSAFLYLMTLGKLCDLSWLPQATRGAVMRTESISVCKVPGAWATRQMFITLTK